MKLKQGFLLHDVDGEHMMVAAGEASRAFHGLVRNNDTADFIFRQLLEDTTEQRIVDAMAQRYDAPRERIEADVRAVLQQAREAGFLDE